MEELTLLLWISWRAHKISSMTNKIPLSLGVDTQEKMDSRYLFPTLTSRHSWKVFGKLRMDQVLKSLPQ